MRAASSVLVFQCGVVLDDPEGLFAGGFVQAGALEELRPAEYGRQWCAQLVRNRSEEFILEAISAFRTIRDGQCLNRDESMSPSTLAFRLFPESARRLSTD